MMSRLGLLTALMMATVSIGQHRARAAAGEDTEEPKSPGGDASAPPPIVIAPVAAEPRSPAASAADGAFGVGLRTRYVSVPGWLLGLFTKHNMPLSTFAHYGVEGYRRRGNFQIALALSYQNMSPPDGNWLGSKHDPMVDTRFLQFRGFSLYSLDVAFTWQAKVSSWFGLHAGAGLGVGLVRGSVYVNVSQGCTDSNLGDLSACHPMGVTCANGVCTPESALSHNASSDVLPLIPIVNLMAGVDFRLPDVKGWEAKLEVGFYDAFFAGLGIGYTF